MLARPLTMLMLPLGTSLSGPLAATCAGSSSGWVAPSHGQTVMLTGEARRVADSDIDPHRALLEGACRGDRRAAEALLKALLPRMRNLVRYFVRGDADVDDIAQEAMVSVLKGLPSYRGEGAVTSWADRIVVRTVFAHIRRSRVSEQRHIEYTPDVAPVSNDSVASSFMSRRRAIRALDEVPNDQREVLVLHHVLGLGVREIAEEIGVPFETVRSRLRLGMARLRAAMGEIDEPEARTS